MRSVHTTSSLQTIAMRHQAHPLIKTSAQRQSDLCNCCSRLQDLAHVRAVCDGGCGCPLQLCCSSDKCVDGATCVPFTATVEVDYKDYCEPVYGPAKRCVPEPATPPDCGKINGTCCYSGGEKTPADGKCTEDTADRKGYCEVDQFFLMGQLGPTCLPGPRKLSGAPDCGKPVISNDYEEAQPCCLNKTCAGDYVCRPNELGHGPHPSYITDELLCFPCEGRNGEACGPQTPNDVKCCADLKSFGPGFPQRLAHCAAPDGSATAGNTTCASCGVDGNACCNESVQGSEAAKQGLLQEDGCLKDASKVSFLFDGAKGKLECREGTCVRVCNADTGAVCCPPNTPDCSTLFS
jgi:hypothetical protein